jgi:hypothetical protein
MRLAALGTDIFNSRDISFTVAESEPSRRLMIALFRDLFLNATPVAVEPENMEYKEWLSVYVMVLGSQI